MHYSVEGCSKGPLRRYEGAEVKWDILCPRWDVPSQAGHPILDVLIGTSCPGHDIPNGTSRHQPGRPDQDMLSQTGRPVWDIMSWTGHLE